MVFEAAGAEHAALGTTFADDGDVPWLAEAAGAGRSALEIAAGDDGGVRCRTETAGAELPALEIACADDGGVRDLLTIRDGHDTLATGAAEGCLSSSYFLASLLPRLFADVLAL